MIAKLGTSVINTPYGKFNFTAWYDGLAEVYSIHKGEISGMNDVPCRMHSTCITSHYFNSIHCDCLEQMKLAQEFIQNAGFGIIVVQNQEAKGNGILATANFDTFNTGTTNSTQAFEKMGLPKDNRNYRSTAFILKEFDVSSIVLLSNSPSRRDALIENGITVRSMKSLIDAENEKLKSFYKSKREIEGHLV